MHDTIHLPNDFRLVNAGQGMKWVGDGFSLFMKQPGMWVLLCLAWGLIQLVATVLPFGSLAMTLLTPTFIAGFMVATAWRARGEELDIAHLFAGFRQLKPLLYIGLAGLLAQLGLALIFGVAMMSILLGAGQNAETIHALSSSLDSKDVLQQLAQLNEFAVKLGPEVFSSLVFAALAGLLFYALIMFGLSLAPALIALGKVAPGLAIRLSFRAIFANWLAFTVYGLIAMTLTLSTIFTLFLGMLVVSPVLIATTYIAYKDIFPDLQDQLDTD